MGALQLFNKKIYSKIIENYHKDKYGNKGEFFCQLFNKKMKVHCDFEVSVDYVEKCIEHLNSLNDSIIDFLCKAIIRYYKDYKDVEEMGFFDIPKDISGRNILNYVFPKLLIVDTPKDNKIGYHLECECVWEEEHGLEFTIKEDKIIYVGDWEDIDAWYDEKYLKTALWNYVNELSIRKATLYDLETLQKLKKDLSDIEIENYHFPIIKDLAIHDEEKEYFIELINKHYVSVATVNNEIIGYLSGTIVEKNLYENIKCGEINSMYVLEDIDGEVGKNLINDFKTYCKERGINKLIVTSNVNNKVTKHFLKDNGFDNFIVTFICHE